MYAAKQRVEDAVKVRIRVQPIQSQVRSRVIAKQPEVWLAEPSCTPWKLLSLGRVEPDQRYLDELTVGTRKIKPARERLAAP